MATDMGPSSVMFDCSVNSNRLLLVVFKFFSKYTAFQIEPIRFKLGINLVSGAEGERSVWCLLLAHVSSSHGDLHTTLLY